MKVNYKMLALAVLTVMGIHASAQQVSEEEAYAKALSFLNGSAQAKARQGKSDNSSIQLAYTGRQGDESHYYVFNSNEGGFVIVGGDECAEDILGYSLTSTFDYDSAPENFKWWLAQYDGQIHSAIEARKAGMSTRRKAMANRADISELIVTKWNQHEPFNLAIPRLGANYSRFVTGCVATAMAQVMYYHRCPASYGYGNNSYSITYNGNSPLTFSADFANTTYDWNNMLPAYNNGGYSETQGNAVATLVYHAGVSVKMHYASSSSASLADAPKALSKYFGYDKSAREVDRKYFTDEEWLDLLYNELAAGRPVLYGGQDAYGGGGHAFVCHGYRNADHTFAINWGWGGYCDGYFTMIGKNGLQPGGNGAGGAGVNASYTDLQDMVINVMPDQGGKSPLIILNTDYYNELPTLTDQNGNKTSSASFNLNDGVQTMRYTFFPWNLSGDDRTFETAVMLKDKVTGASFITEHRGRQSLNHTSLYRETINIKSTDLRFNGTYDVYPVARENENDEWERILIDASIAVPTITVTGGEEQGVKKDVAFSISSNTVEERSTLTISHDNFYTGTITYSAYPAGIVNIDNHGKVTALRAGNVTITARCEANEYFNATTATFDVEVTPYIKKNIEFSINETSILIGKSAQITYAAKDYTGTVTYSSSDQSIATVDANGKITAVNKGNVTITANATEDDTYKQTSKTFNIIVTEEGFNVVDYSIANNGYVTPSTVSITATFKNNTGIDYTSDFYYVYCVFDIGNYTFTFSSGRKPWYDGSKYEITFAADKYEEYFTGFIGKTGTITFLDNSKNPISDPIPFTVCREIDITHTLTSAGYSTLTLPFEAAVPEGLIAYSVSGANNGVLIKEEAEKFEMNKPYLVSGTPGNYTFTGPDTPYGSDFRNGIMVGNTAPSTEDAAVYAPTGSYVLQNNNDVLGFYQVTKDNAQKIRQYSAYINSGELETKALYFIDETTGIHALADTPVTTDAPAYNLNGIRVKSNAKGFVIVNGKLIYNK